MLKIIEGLPPDVDGDRSCGQGNALRILPEVESPQPSRGGDAGNRDLEE
jgi:hypothetical protein